MRFCSAIALAELPNRVDDNLHVFNLLTALTDAEGRIWQRICKWSVCEIWKHLLRRREWTLHFEDWKRDPRFSRALNVERRIIAGPLMTICDNREHALVEVIRPRGGDAGSWKLSPYEKCEKLLFRLRFKYFGARVTVLEQTVTNRLNTGEESSDTQVVFIVQSLVSMHPLVVFDEMDRVLGTERSTMMDIGPLEVRIDSLCAQWSEPAWGPVEPGDPVTWQKLLYEAGIEPAEHRAMQPQEGIVLPRP